MLDSEGVKVSHSSWDSPSDESADDALARIGWTRSGPWESDGFGRHTARVLAVAAREPIPLPPQPTAPLAEGPKHPRRCPPVEWSRNEQPAAAIRAAPTDRWPHW